MRLGRSGFARPWQDGFHRSIDLDLGPTTRAAQYSLTWKKGDPADRDGNRVFELRVFFNNPRAEARAKSRGFGRDYFLMYGYDADHIELAFTTRFVMRPGEWLGEGGISAKGHETVVRRALRAHAVELCRLHKLSVRHRVAATFARDWYCSCFDHLSSRHSQEKMRAMAARCKTLGAAPMPANFRSAS